MSIDSGELQIGRLGFAMAKKDNARDILQLRWGSKPGRNTYLRGKLGYTADNLYFGVNQDTAAIFLSHATRHMSEIYMYM